MDADEIMYRIFGASLVEFRVASAKANEDHPGQSRYDFLDSCKKGTLGLSV